MTDNTPQTKEALLNIDQLAAYLGISKDSIYRRRRHTTIDLPPAIKIGKNLRWRKSDVDNWVANQQTV
ncbi:MAG: helix-turn-helix domain-containing protein [Bifidobacterium sp.]|nr:helix-turn-helix domain-containing protein [Bifidobacterium sp.]